MSSMEIYLLRHGQASFGKPDYDELSETGRHQSEVLASHLLERNIHFDQVVHGSLRRQRDTAGAYLQQAGNIPLAVRSYEHSGFNEFQAERIVKHYLPRILLDQPDLANLLQQPGGFEKNFQTIFISVLRSWQRNSYPHDHIERWSSFEERVINALRDLLAQENSAKKIGIFTSGGVIAALLKHALGADDSLLWRLNMRIANASVTRLSWDGEHLNLSFFNNYDHLQTSNLLTFR